ncbi:uncharacterized protein LOC130503313, partial [Raphanus sativus]|uniref:Uncharacterized protein LOC130503313 n=1 Tax=Raphanus sativus TaxID=3726 RepID=A0A9W3CR04_RAPSA
FNEEEILAGLNRRSGPRTYADVGGSRGGDSNGNTPKPEDYNPWMGGGSGGARVDDLGERPTRKLDDVDDDEFDIPPMFDDTEYDVSEIPDMDVGDHYGEIAVGKVFGSKEDCQIALAIYAIKKQFRYTQTRTKVDSFVVECPDKRCDWRVTAHEIRGCGYYEIRKAKLEHLCPIEFRQGYKSRATSRVIAAVYKAKFGNPGKAPVARDLQKLLLEDLRVNASYMTCYRAKEKAIIGVRGTDEDAYAKLPEYLYMLKLANPGTVADLETDVDDDGDERFLYLFLAFGASISGFRKLRHVLVIDGTHLSGKYKGVLLTASGQDANFQIFPLAFAIVDAEDEDAWTWFLQKVERILSDSPTLAIISDRAVSIANAVSKIYPQAKHGACIVHLARNVNSRYSSKHLAELVTKTAMAHMPREYKELYGKVRSTNSACGVYLGKIGTARWSRWRGANILELVKFIQRMMTRWFSARRKKAAKHTGGVTVEVDKEMTKNMATVNGSYINSVNEWTCQVLANGLGVSTETLCGHWYKTSVWRETYAGEITPDEDPRDVDLPDEVREQAPKKKESKNRCGRCGGFGHNRTNCVRPI